MRPRRMARVKPPFGRREPAASSPEAAQRPAPSSLADLAPSRVDTLAQGAYLELVLFQELSDLVPEAPRLDGKQAIGQAAGEALERHEGFLARLADEGVDAAAELRRVGPSLDAFVERVRGRDMPERLLACYLVSGLLHDVYRELVGQFPAAPRLKAEPLLDDAEEQEMLRGVIGSMIEASPTTGDRIAMWGRRIMGDCIVLVRELFGLPRGRRAPESEHALVQTFTSALLANHSRRMSAIGLAA